MTDGLSLYDDNVKCLLNLDRKMILTGSVLMKSHELTPESLSKLMRHCYFLLLSRENNRLHESNISKIYSSITAHKYREDE